MTIDEQIYGQLQDILGDLRQLPEHAKMSSGGFMDLNMDLLGAEGEVITIALSHYYKHPSGDMIADPDMEIRIIPLLEAAEALSYQDSFGYRRVYFDENDRSKVNRCEQRLQNAFLHSWLHNIKAKGYKLTEETKRSVNKEGSK